MFSSSGMQNELQVYSRRIITVSVLGATVCSTSLKGPAWQSHKKPQTSVTSSGGGGGGGGGPTAPTTKAH